MSYFSKQALVSHRCQIRMYLLIVDLTGYVTMQKPETDREEATHPAVVVAGPTDID